MEKGLQVIEGRTYLNVSHQNKTLTFAHPAFGYNWCQNVANEIRNAGLVQPTMAQTASLVRGAFESPDNKYSKDIIDKMRTNWLWASNGLLFIPNKGVYIQDRPIIQNGMVSMSMNESDLTARLEANDPSVRFVPFGFKTGEQSSRDLAKNELMIGLSGEEGAEEIAKISTNYQLNPKVYALDNVSKTEFRFTAIGSDKNFRDDRLCVGGWSGCFGSAYGLLAA